MYMYIQLLIFLHTTNEIYVNQFCLQFRCFHWNMGKPNKNMLLYSSLPLLLVVHSNLFLIPERIYFSFYSNVRVRGFMLLDKCKILNST